MTADSELSDEYVLGMLKKDASNLQSLLHKRPTGTAPKPNTRFLRNILRETDSHNAALLAKEQREARARQKAMENEAHRDASPRSSRRRSYVEQDADQARRKRRRTDDSPSRKRKRHDRCRSISQDRSKRHEKSTNARLEVGRLSRDLDENPSGEKESRRTKHRHSRKDRDRSRSPAQRSKHRHREKERHRDRHRQRRDSTSPSRTPSPRRHKEHSRHTRERSTSPSGSKPRSSKHTASRILDPALETARARASPESASDSDPLESIIGPPPPPPEPKVRSRGRGAFTSSSAAMDSHFASNYDPSADVRPHSESDDDWDQALEALRDRQKWNKQGADRLRAAGFTEAEVKKWEKGDKKDESDVRWAKKGEGREWDRGKVVDEDGAVDLKPEWGRLKGT